MPNQELSSRALSLFHEKPKRFNCAQTIAATFEREDLIEPLKSCGGGRAPGGLCGALYAATLIACEEKSEVIKEQFQQTIGHQECKLIKQTSKATCSDCVQCAAKILS